MFGQKELSISTNARPLIDVFYGGDYVKLEFECQLYGDVADTLRHRIILRPGRLTRPQGELTLTMSANTSVLKGLLHFLNAVQKATWLKLCQENEILCHFRVKKRNLTCYLTFL